MNDNLQEAAMKHHFQLFCTVELDDEMQLDDNAARRIVAERLGVAIEQSTAAEALSEAMHGSVLLGMYEDYSQETV